MEMAQFVKKVEEWREWNNGTAAREIDLHRALLDDILDQ